MDFSELIHGSFYVVTWICQSCCGCGFVACCHMYFSPFAKQNRADVWPGFQRLLMLLLWNKGVDWVKTLNAFGPLCLWKCFQVRYEWKYMFIPSGQMRDINTSLWKCISYPYFAGHITALSIGQTLESLLLKH